MKTNGDATGLVGVRGAARALSLSPSTVSRYLKDNPSLNLGDEMNIKIDVAALQRHRLENLNAARRGSYAGRLLGKGNRSAANTPNYADSKAKREAVLAARAQIDLDEKKGLLVPRAEIEAAIFESGQALQRDLLELGAQLSERIAVMDDPREIAELLVTEHRRILAALANSLRADAAAENEPRPR